MKLTLAQLIGEIITDSKIICDNCGWSWNKADGGDDLYICHKCGHDNTPHALENYSGTSDKLTVVSVIDGKRNLDSDQIRQLFFDDNVGGTFYLHTNEEGEYKNSKPISRQDAVKYIDYYNARLKKDNNREEKLGAELGVLGIESELQFKQGEFKTDTSIFSANENYKDGKVKGKSKPGRVKKSGASCNGSVADLRAKAKKYGGEKGKMYHWCANMKGGK